MVDMSHKILPAVSDAGKASMRSLYKIKKPLRRPAKSSARVELLALLSSSLVVT